MLPGAWLLLFACLHTVAADYSGALSRRELHITLLPDEQVRIWGLNNLQLSGGSENSSVQRLCAWSSSGAARLSVSTENSMRLLSYGNSVGYAIRVSSSSSGPWLGLQPGHEVRLELNNAPSPMTCCHGTGRGNIYLMAIPDTTSGHALAEGHYSDTVTLTLSPE